MSEIEYLDKPKEVGPHFLHRDGREPTITVFSEYDVDQFTGIPGAKYSFIEPHPAPPVELPKDVVLRCRCVKRLDGNDSDALTALSCSEGHDCEVVRFGSHLESSHFVATQHNGYEWFDEGKFFKHFQLIEDDQ